MTDREIVLAKTQLLSSGDGSANSSWSNLHESAYGFAREHSTELAAGALALVGAAGVWKLGSSALAARSAATLENKLPELASNGLSKAAEQLVKTPLTDVTKSVFASSVEGGSIARSGNELLSSFNGAGLMEGAHFASTMKSMKGIEIPRFAEAYAGANPNVAAGNIGFILTRSPMAEGSEMLWNETLKNIMQPGKLRTGEQLFKEFAGNGQRLAGSHFADTMRSMQAAEIPRFAREYFASVPKSAANNVQFVLDRAAMAPGTDKTWQAALTELRKLSS